MHGIQVAISVRHGSNHPTLHDHHEYRLRSCIEQLGTPVNLGASRPKMIHCA